MIAEDNALLVFTVDRPELEDVMRDDPYYHRTPGVEVRSIREWTPVVGAPESA
ncbi:hypothetical protein [Streptomyces sp. NPDC002088]|uniref:hypothetical protein n=1 Tax=Streptomyces sp. NPDC002088 TaxID=3154665 RepID=UPI00332FBE55